MHLSELRRIHGQLHGALDALFRDMNPTEAGRLLILVDDRLTALINTTVVEAQAEAEKPAAAKAPEPRPAPAEPAPAPPPVAPSARPAPEPVILTPKVVAAPVVPPPLTPPPPIVGPQLASLKVVPPPAPPAPAAAEPKPDPAPLEEQKSAEADAEPLFRTDWLSNEPAKTPAIEPVSRAAPVLPDFEAIVREAKREAVAASSEAIAEAEPEPDWSEPADVPGADDDVEPPKAEAPPKVARFSFPKLFAGRGTPARDAEPVEETLPEVEEKPRHIEPREDHVSDGLEFGTIEASSPAQDADPETTEDGVAPLPAEVETDAPEDDAERRTGITSRLFGSLRGALFGGRRTRDERPDDEIADRAEDALDDERIDDLDRDEDLEEEIAAFDEDFDEQPLTAEEQVALLHDFADELIEAGVMAPAMRQTGDRILLRKVDDGIDVAVKGFPTPLGTVRVSEDGESAVYHPQLGMGKALRAPNRADLETWLRAMGDVVVSVMADIVARRGGGSKGG